MKKFCLAFAFLIAAVTASTAISAPIRYFMQPENVRGSATPYSCRAKVIIFHDQGCGKLASSMRS